MILFLLYNVVVGNEVGRCEFSGNDKITSKLDKLVGNSFSTTHKINDKEYEFKVNFCGNGVADQGQSTMVYRVSFSFLFDEKLKTNLGRNR